MKLIQKYKSPNYNIRKKNIINFIIIHYTALETLSESIEYLCAKSKKVSSHYLISKKGDVFQLVHDKQRAWHAGKSYWQGEHDINSVSLGIELDYRPSKNNKYNKKLIISLIKLLKKLMKKYKIKPEKILGHSDIAPYRKIDPGKQFPWSLLERKKIAFKIIKLKEKKVIKNFIKIWFTKYNFKSKKKIILFMLSIIGYDISLAVSNKLYYDQLILIYSNRFNLYKSYSYNKKNIFSVIELHFFNILLTKTKK